MKKVIIKKNGIEAFGAEMEDPTVWINECIANNIWGKDAWTETIPATDDTPEHYIQHAAEYTVEIQDITAQVAAEQAQIDAIKQAQLKSAMALQALPMQIDACPDLESLKTLIKQFVVNVATLLQG
jgi:hypothetical protein